MNRLAITISLLLAAAASGVMTAAQPRRPIRQAASGQGRKLAPGTRVAIRNLNGPVTVTGWDRDSVEASAGDQSLEVRIYDDPSVHGVMITPDVATHSRGGEVH